jgi:hypothetical protein
VINSAELHCGIKRQHAEVRHKNLITFTYKIIWIDSAELENNLYKNIYNITLCNFGRGSSDA